MKEKTDLLALALDKLTAELGEWRKAATYLTITGTRSPFKSHIDIEVQLRDPNQLEEIGTLMQSYLKEVNIKVDDSNAEGSKEEAKLTHSGNRHQVPQYQ